MFPKINQKQMEKMMNKMGMKQEQIPATEVIIKSPGKDIIIKNPNVVKVNMMGQDTYQVTGDTSEGIGISKEDILTVAHQTDVSELKAKEALEKNNGDLAEAIMELQK